MEMVVLIGVILVVALVMASGIWVGSVLIAAVARIHQPAPFASSQVMQRTDT